MRKPLASTAGIAKLTPPILPKVVLRTRLFRHLDAATVRPIVWITGIPGIGKTTLVASYLQKRSRPVFWYRFDEGDSEPGVFFHYMEQASTRIAFGKGNPPLPTLAPEYLGNLATFTRRFFQALCQRLPSRTVLVFDDYHTVLPNSMLHEAFASGLAEVPASINAMVISRHALPEKMAPLLASQQIETLDPDTLRLTSEELKACLRLRQLWQQAPDDEQVNILQKRLNGWVSGVVLMSEQIKNKQIHALSPPIETLESICSFFSETIFHQIDTDVRAFLLETALLPQMTAKMAQAVTSSINAESILERLFQQHYFITRHTLPSPIYRYHELFREFLLACQRRELSPASLTSLMHRSAVVLEASGDVEHALILFQQTKNWTQVERCVLSCAKEWVASGRERLLATWIAALPASVVAANAWLIYWRGVCTMPLDPVRSSHFFEEAFALFHRRQEWMGAYLAWLMAGDALVQASENFAPMDTWITLMHDVLLKECPHFPSPEIEMGVVSNFHALLLFRQPHHPDILIWAERASTLMRNNTDPTLRRHAQVRLAVYYLWTGNFGRASFFVDLIQGEKSTVRLSVLSQLTGISIRALHAWLTGETDRCLKIVSEGLSFSSSHGVHLWDQNFFCQGIAAALSDGNTQKAEMLIEQMKPGLLTARRIDLSFYHYLISWYGLIRNDLPLATTHATMALSHATELNSPFVLAVAHIGVAHVLWEKGQNKEAAEAASQALDIGYHMRSTLIQYMGLVTQAGWTLEEGDGNRALRQAFALGREQGFVNMFGWRASVMVPLCIRALDTGIEVAYVKHLIQSRDLVPLSPPRALESWPWPVKIYTLGRFLLIHRGVVVSFPKKVQRKPLEMLKTLLALGGRRVLESDISDSLWPDADGDVAANAFKITLHRLRKLMGHDEAILFHERHVTLNPRVVWVDIWAFNQGLSTSPPQPAEIKSVLALYRGRFLPQEDALPVVEPARERLHRRFLQIKAMLHEG